MRFSIFFLIPFLFQPQDQRILTGTVAIENEAVAGCEVFLTGSKITHFTDQDGRFKLPLDNHKKETLVIRYLNGWACSVVIEDVQLQSDAFDFGTVPLVYNKMVTISEYEELSPVERKEYEEVRHWAHLLGYINKTTADTTALRVALWTDRRIRYRYDPAENRVLIRFEDWRP
jgi:hypothetical protein